MGALVHAAPVALAPEAQRREGLVASRLVRLDALDDDVAGLLTTKSMVAPFKAGEAHGQAAVTPQKVGKTDIVWGAACYWDNASGNSCWVKDNHFVPEGFEKADCNGNGGWCCAAGGRNDCDNNVGKNVECSDQKEFVDRVHVTTNMHLVVDHVVDQVHVPKPFCISF